MLPSDLAHQIHQYCLRTWMENEEPTTHTEADHIPQCLVYMERVLDEEDLKDTTVRQLSDTILRLGISTGEHWAHNVPSPTRVIEELRRARQIGWISD